MKTIKYAESDDENASDESDEVVVKPKKVGPPARPIAKKKKKIVDSDSNGEDSDNDKPSKRARKGSAKAISRKKAVQSESEIEESSDDGSDEDGSDEDDEIESSNGEENGKPVKRRPAAKASVKSEKKTKKIRSGEPTAKTLKALTRLERLEESRKAYKWWEVKELPNGLMWRRLEHPGVLFAPPYERHGVPLLYNGEPVDLTNEQEEIATFFASIPEDGPQLGNPKTREVFKTNFFNDFKAVLPPGHVIKKMDKCDFSRIKAHLDMQRSLKKAANEEEKAIAKKEKEGLVLKYGYALIDGRIEK
ncbi:TOP1B, partial [Symbiodinium microadriaticum]